MTEDRLISLDTLLEGNQVVLWDTSSLKAASLKLHIQENFRLIAASRGKVLVPEFVYKALEHPQDDMALVAVDKQLYQKLEGAGSYADTFRLLQAAGHPIVSLVLNDTAKRPEIFDAATAAKLFVKFCYLNDEGKLTEPPKPAAKPQPKPQSAPVTPKPRPRPQGFAIKSVPERVAIAPLPANEALTLGSQVTDSKGNTYHLLKREAVSNQAVTYSTDVTGVWVKLFDSRGLTTFTEAKVRRMLTQQLNCPGICWPLDVVTDSAGCFRGYLMPGFSGTPLHLSVFKRAGIETYFPRWNKMNLCLLTLTILEKIRYLHNHNVLLGCINPAAILVSSTDKVYFTDTDNYQIEGFPTTVYNLSFTPPELLDKKIFLATRENEYFAVAQLVFMLMMPGKTPYADGSDAAPRDLIRKRNFPYAMGRFTGSYVLPGMWRMTWSHLDSLRGSFYNVFHRNGKFSAPQDRRDVGYWESAVKHYKEYLLQPENRDSLALYPTTFKKEPGETFYRCRFCGVEHPKEYFDREYFQHFQICNGCLEKQSNVFFKCDDCGRTFYYSNRTALFHRLRKMQDSDWKDQKHCSDCKSKTATCKSCGQEMPFYRLKNDLCSTCNQARLNRVCNQKYCRDCGRLFDITVKDFEYFSQPGMHMPTRCKTCRDSKKSGISTRNPPPPKKGFFGRFF